MVEQAFMPAFQLTFYHCHSERHSATLGAE
jgi:hypothetical protein